VSDNTKTVEMNMASAGAITLAPHSAVPFPIGGYTNLVSSGVGQITVTPSNGVTIHARNGLALSGQYAVGSLQQIRENEWIFSGDAATSVAVFAEGSIIIDEFTVSSNSNTSLASVALTDHATSSASATHTLSGLNIGSGDAHRNVCIVVGYGTSSPDTTYSLSSATIGGVTATIQAQSTSVNGGYNTAIAVISAQVPSGTTATVVLNFTGACGIAVAVYSVVSPSGVVYSQSSRATGTTVTINRTATSGDVFIAGDLVFSLGSNTFSLTGTSADDVVVSSINVGVGTLALHTRSINGASPGTVTSSVVAQYVSAACLTQWR
jgi:hypothetical protein